MDIIMVNADNVINVMDTVIESKEDSFVMQVVNSALETFIPLLDKHCLSWYIIAGRSDCIIYRVSK